MDPSKPSRGSSRFVAGLPALLHAVGKEQACEAYDLSRSGTLLIGAISANAGESVQVTLLSVRGDFSVALAATAVRFENDEAGLASRLAVEFRDLDDDAREGIATLIARVVEGMGPTALDALPPNAQPEQIRAALEKIPLAHRLTLAGRAAPRERALLMQDPNPQVLDSLARNPQLLQTEIRALLRLPLLLPATLESLSRDPRWRGSEELRVAIASHRSTTADLAERIANSLSPAGVQQLLRQGSLNTALRRKLIQAPKPR